MRRAYPHRAREILFAVDPVRGGEDFALHPLGRGEEAEARLRHRRAARRPGSGSIDPACRITSWGDSYADTSERYSRRPRFSRTVLTEIAHYIEGARSAGRSGCTRPVYNPATGEAEKTVALASVDEVERAIASAKSAWPAWARLGPDARTPALRRVRIPARLKMILWERGVQLAEVIAAEHGKTRDDALGEVTRGLEVVEFVVGALHLLRGEITENVGAGGDPHALRQPLGAVAGITPFNVPAMVPMWMFPVALACGNTSTRTAISWARP